MAAITPATPESIAAAAALLHTGRVVAFPTETVYGLGADARNPAAVRQIFELKGRPHDHPLIVHIAEALQLAEWAGEVSPAATMLAKTFWPGPLTLIVRRAAGVPDAVTGGLQTVGVRVPAHPVALALLKSFGGGVAAPSANRFGAVSPTTAEHVRAEFGVELELVLDGGACSVGVESTIVDCSGATPRILRPGGVTREALELALGSAVPIAEKAEGVRAPGMLPSHYAPHAQVLLCAPEEIAERTALLLRRGLKVAVLAQTGVEFPAGAVRVPVPGDLEGLARSIYAALREVDRLQCQAAVVSLPPEEGLGAAVADRLRRAAAPRD